MNYLFTSESVSEGHPDKVSDQISDALLDQFLAFDSNSKVAIETLVTTGQVVVAGEVKSSAYVDVEEVHLARHRGATIHLHACREKSVAHDSTRQLAAVM